MRTTNDTCRMSFTIWRRNAERVCETRTGLSLQDMVDAPYYDWYERGVSPSGAVSRVIRREHGDE